jgi:hypothetical protein
MTCGFSDFNGRIYALAGVLEWPDLEESTRDPARPGHVQTTRRACADVRCLALATTARSSHGEVLAVLVDPAPDHDVDDPQHAEVSADASFRANALS